MIEQFNDIRKRLEEFEEKREETIRNSREIISLSKQIIYSVQREDFEVDNLIKKINEKIKLLEKTQKYDTQISSVAFQEYVEAIVFYEFIKNKRIPGFIELDVGVEDYLMGLCDLTGELARKSVLAAIKNNVKDVEAIRDFVDDLHLEFLKLNLRNGELRKKYDSIKWNQRKIEDVLFSLKTK
ncbi:hypothetical protein J4436_00525 [Candidatus Woesearchaeota archaeon]|nr:hypothetical protein [Candidatus Woesearchaeota archaeon]